MTKFALIFLVNSYGQIFQVSEKVLVALFFSTERCRRRFSRNLLLRFFLSEFVEFFLRKGSKKLLISKSKMQFCENPKLWTVVLFFCVFLFSQVVWNFWLKLVWSSLGFGSKKCCFCFLFPTSALFMQNYFDEVAKLLKFQKYLGKGFEKKTNFVIFLFHKQQ